MNKNNLLPNPFDQDPLPQWDKNEVWQQIEAQLPPRKRRRLAAWWWWLGIGSVTVGALYWVLPLSTDNQPRPIAEFASPEMRPQGVNNNSKNSLSPEKNNALLGQNTDQKDIKRSIVLPLEIIKNTNIPNVYSDKTIVQSQTDLFVSPIPARDTMASYQAVNTITTNTSPLPVKGVGHPLPPVLKVLFLTDISPFLPVFSPYMPVLPAHPLPVKPLPARIRFTFGMDGGATFRRIKARTAADAALAGTYQTATRPMETIGLQGGLFYQLNNHWSVGSGLRYQSTQHWFRFSEKTTLVEQITSDSATYYEINGMTYYQSGLLNQTTTTTRTINSPGSIARFFIPFALQYTATQGFYGQMGLLWNVHSRYRGYALSPQGTVLAKDNQTGIAGVYSNKGAHAAQIGIGYRLVLRKGWQVRAGVQYQIDWGAVIAPLSGLRQRDQVLGLSLSLLR